MGLEVGLVGLPNVGKSTLFRALTKAKAEVGNYPFCTIDPNVGIVPVLDPRLDRLTKLVDPNKVVHSTLKVVDIAGLVAGASKGEGLGNQFLAVIREMDAVAHVVRCFDDDNIIHVAGRTDPLSDLEVILTELVLSDLEQVERKLDRATKQSKGDKEAAASLPALKRMVEHLGEGRQARSLALSQDEEAVIKPLSLITRKPYLYVANVDERGLREDSQHVQKLNALAKSEGVRVVKICAQIEAELSEMDAEEAALFMAEMGIGSSGLAALSQTLYELLNQITYFTAGKQEVRAWNIPAGTLAPQAAGKIHTDFERGFICAEVYHFSDIDELGSESAVKDAGRKRLEGREYVFRDGDVVHFRFNV